MAKEKICPLKAGIICSPKCGLYSKLDEMCSLRLLAEAAIAIVDLRGRVFTTKILNAGRVTIPLDIREELSLKYEDRIKLIVVKDER